MSTADRQRLEAVLGMLSPRQGQVARLMLDGASYRSIADELGLGDSTVRNHIRRIRQRMKLV